MSDFLKRSSGLVLDESKRYLLETRLFPLLKQHAIDSLDSLAMMVMRDESGKLAEDVVHAMTTNETLFFRDKYPYDALREMILPELSKSLPASSRINIWSAACSKGQEPYSIAMTVMQALPGANSRVSVTATDLDRNVLNYAEQGSYTQMEVQRGLPVQMLVSFFEQDGEQWRVNKKLRHMVNFRRANLISPTLAGELASDSPFHVVFCRNVLIYFDPQQRAKVIDGIASVTRPGGYLITGAAEGVSGARSRWQAVLYQGRRLWQLQSRS